MRLFSLILLLTPLAVMVKADRKIFGNGTLPEFLQQFDTNQDGLIDEEERQAIRDLRSQMRDERRDSIDLNRNGEISAEEIEIAREDLRIRIEKRRLRKFDNIAGEDKIISLQEFATIPGMERIPDVIFDAIWQRLDLDGSGDISAEEFLHRLRTHR